MSIKNLASFNNYHPLKRNLQLTFKIIIINNCFNIHFKTANKILTHLIFLVLLMKLHV